MPMPAAAGDVDVKEQVAGLMPTTEARAVLDRDIGDFGVTRLGRSGHVTSDQVWPGRRRIQERAVTVPRRTGIALATEGRVIRRPVSHPFRTKGWPIVFRAHPQRADSRILSIPDLTRAGYDQRV